MLGIPIGVEVQITVPYGLETRKIYATVIRDLGNDMYELEGENGNRYIRKCQFVECTELF